MFNYGDTLSMSKYQFYIAESFSKKSDGTEYAAGDNIKQTDNII